MSLSRLRSSPSRLLMVACLSVTALLASADSSQAGPLTAANVNVYDGATLLVAGVDYTASGAGVAGAYTLTVMGSSTHFSFLFTLGQSNHPGGPLWSELKQTASVTRSGVASGTGKTLKIEFSDVGYTFPPGPDARLASASSATFTASDPTNAATFQSYADPGNGLFGTAITTLLESASSPGVPAGAVALTGDLPYVDFAKGPAFSLTNVMTFSLSDSSSGLQVIGTTTVTQTPEPTSMTLLGMGLVGMAGYGLRRWRKQTKTQDLPAGSAV